MSRLKDRYHNALYFKMQELDKGKKSVGDSGYDVEPGKRVCSKAKVFYTSEFQEFLVCGKNREETLHTGFKCFNIL